MKFDGTKVGSASNGTSPGNGYVSLPIPIQNYTTNAGVEGGYQSGKLTFALRWDYSKFNNSDQTLQWTNPFFGNQLDTSYLAPDNTFNKITATANYRDLPWHSVIAARYTYAKTTDNVNLATSAINSQPIVAANNLTLPDASTFNGEHVNQSFALTWTALPISTLESRVHYYWTKLENNSDQIAYGNAPTNPLPSGLGCGNFYPPGSTTPTVASGNCEPDLFAYTKNDVGFDLWWRFTKGQRLGFGYDYLKYDTDRVDYSGYTDNKVWLEYKNTMLDNLTGRLKYQYAKRDGQPNDPGLNVDGGANNDLYLQNFTSAFDMQSSTTNQVKLNLDWTPMQLLALSFEANWIKQNFDDVTYGRNNNDRQAYYLNGSWGDPNKLLVSAFGDWEEVKYPSSHRYIGTVANGPTPPPGWCTAAPAANANPNCYSPTQNNYFIPAGSSSLTGSYNWASQTKDQTWMLGAGMDWPVNSQWMVKASYIYVSNQGNATFSSVNNYGNPLNIGNFDDTKQQYFNLKANYAYNKSWSFTGGYAYEKYSRDDIGAANYTNLTVSPVVTPVSTSTSYLNGYNLNPNGNQNIFWVGATYKFDAPPLPVAQLKTPEPPPPPKVVAPPPPPPPPPPAPKTTTLSADELFAFDKAVLSDKAAAALDAIAADLNRDPKAPMVPIVGYTDRLGSDAYNLRLSQARADAVRNYLVSKGVAASRLQATGKGEADPVVQCTDKNRDALIKCLAPNRRVVIGPVAVPVK